jgi:hypothetical protein
MAFMAENAFIHDVYVNVSWPLLVVATILLLFLVMVVWWVRRR